MPRIVHTARSGYRGVDRLDVDAQEAARGVRGVG